MLTPFAHAPLAEQSMSTCGATAVMTLFAHDFAPKHAIEQLVLDAHTAPPLHAFAVAGVPHVMLHSPAPVHFTGPSAQLSSPVHCTLQRPPTEQATPSRHALFPLHTTSHEPVVHFTPFE